MSEPSEADAVRISLIAAGMVLLFLLVGAWWLDRQNQYQGPPPHYRHLSYTVTPATIQGWMTFNYLDRIFSLPPSYLENALNIEDPRYPDVSIDAYAEARGLDPVTFLEQVQATLSGHTATSTP